MTDVEWHKFDYDDKSTAPPKKFEQELVWIYEEHYLEGIGLGYFDGFIFRMWTGTDDCSVSHWAEIQYPEFAPEQR